MTNACTGKVIVKSLYLEPQYMYMIIAWVCWCALKSIDIVYIYAFVCMRSHGAALARVFTHAPARMCVMRSRSPASGLVAGAMHAVGVSLLRVMPKVVCSYSHVLACVHAICMISL